MLVDIGRRFDSRCAIAHEHKSPAPFIIVGTPRSIREESERVVSSLISLSGGQLFGLIYAIVARIAIHPGGDFFLPSVGHFAQIDKLCLCESDGCCYEESVTSLSPPGKPGSRREVHPPGSKGSIHDACKAWRRRLDLEINTDFVAVSAEISQSQVRSSYPWF
jgi:hypothetical protein